LRETANSTNTARFIVFRNSINRLFNLILQK
jgi:hypothetical protein